MIKWQYFPKSKEIPTHLRKVVDEVFVPNSATKKLGEIINIPTFLRMSECCGGWPTKNGSTSSPQVRQVNFYGLIRANGRIKEAGHQKLGDTYE